MSNDIVQADLFNYSAIDADTSAYLQQNAHETRGLLKRTTEDIIQIGKNLLEAKARLPHGQFIPWVKAELGISQSTAWRFMQVAQGKQIGKSVTVNDVMEQIAAPDTQVETVDAKPSEEKEEEESQEGWLAYDLHAPWPTDPTMVAVHDVLMSGYLLNRVCKKKTFTEANEFAWLEFRLWPEVAPIYMLYAARYPEKAGMLPPHVVSDMVALKGKRDNAIGYLCAFLNHKKEAIPFLMHTARCFMVAKYTWERKGEDFNAWVETRFHIPAHVAITLIEYLTEEYIDFPTEEVGDSCVEAKIDEVPMDFVFKCADLFTQYKLYNVHIRMDDSIAK